MVSSSQCKKNYLVFKVVMWDFKELRSVSVSPVGISKQVISSFCTLMSHLYNRDSNTSMCLVCLVFLYRESLRAKFCYL